LARGGRGGRGAAALRGLAKMDVATKQDLKRDVKALRNAIAEGFRLRILKDGTWAGMVRIFDG
jgi:hypothetical protein